MFKENPVFNPPADAGVTVWRYMDVDKFTDLVTSRTLYLARADRFPDKFEGLLPTATKAEWPSLAEWIRDARSQTFVSCWQLNTHESDLMWTGYLGGKKGVVVQSTYQRLTAALAPCNEAVFVGTIGYMDYDDSVLEEWKRHPNISAPILHKRLEYKDDREIRVVLNTMSDTALRARGAGETGVRIPIDVDTLIDQVRLMPRAGADLAQQVNDALQSAGLSKPVVASALDKSPP
jgi:hypothetical protein